MKPIKLRLGTALARDMLAFVATIAPRRAEECERAMNKVQLGMDVVLTPAAPEHTDEQRGYYWLSLHAFGGWLGYTAKEVERDLHRIICCEAYGTKDRDGDPLGLGIPVATSSHDEHGRKRDRESYSDLIETLIRFAAEQGYAVPPPTIRSNHG